MTALCDHDLATFADELRRLGHNPAHARRVLRAYYAAGGSLPNLGQLPVNRLLRDDLHRADRLMRSRPLSRRVAADGTVKLLVGFPDGATCEAVLMPAHRPDRAAGCVSSQVGCAMGCDFCASTKHGLTRDLTTSEIVEQFLHLRAEAQRDGRRLASLVFMGMGEPLLNLDYVIDRKSVV